jgi:hypothetical protein
MEYNEIINELVKGVTESSRYETLTESLFVKLESSVNIYEQRLQKTSNNQYDQCIKMLYTFLYNTLFEAGMYQVQNSAVSSTHLTNMYKGQTYNGQESQPLDAITRNFSQARLCENIVIPEYCSKISSFLKYETSVGNFAQWTHLVLYILSYLDKDKLVHVTGDHIELETLVIDAEFKSNVILLFYTILLLRLLQVKTILTNQLVKNEINTCIAITYISFYYYISNNVKLVKRETGFFSFFTTPKQATLTELVNIFYKNVKSSTDFSPIIMDMYLQDTTISKSFRTIHDGFLVAKEQNLTLKRNTTDNLVHITNMLINIEFNPWTTRLYNYFKKLAISAVPIAASSIYINCFSDSILKQLGVFVVGASISYFYMKRKSGVPVAVYILGLTDSEQINTSIISPPRGLPMLIWVRSKDGLFSSIYNYSPVSQLNIQSQRGGQSHIKYYQEFASIKMKYNASTISLVENSIRDRQVNSDLPQELQMYVKKVLNTMDENEKYLLLKSLAKGYIVTELPNRLQ